MLYTLTERNKFSYNNKVYIGFQKVKNHTSKRINKVTQHRSLSVSFSSVQYFGHIQLFSLVLILTILLLFFVVFSFRQHTKVGNYDKYAIFIYHPNLRAFS